MANDLAIYQKIENPIQAATEMGKFMALSGMLGLKNEQAGAVVAMTCLAEGITPIDFGRTYHVVQGRPSMRADAMLAEFRKKGGKHKILQRDEQGASVELTASDGSSGTFTLTWEEAKKEDFAVGKDGGVKDNYAYPRKRMQMLWARVISDGVRTLAPEIVAGTYTPEEMSDEAGVVFTQSAETTEQKAPPTPAEAVAAAAARAQETEDATFEMKDESSGASPDGLANDIQVGRLASLVADLELKPEAVQSFLAKRNVNAFTKLTGPQADEIIEKLEAKLRQKNAK